MAPTTDKNTLELIYVIKLLAKSVEEIAKDLETLIDQETRRAEILQCQKESSIALTAKVDALPTAISEKFHGIEQNLLSVLSGVSFDVTDARSRIYSIRRAVKVIEDALVPKSSGSLPLIVRDRDEVTGALEFRKDGMVNARFRWPSWLTFSGLVKVGKWGLVIIGILLGGGGAAVAFKTLWKALVGG